MRVILIIAITVLQILSSSSRAHAQSIPDLGAIPCLDKNGWLAPGTADAFVADEWRGRQNSVEIFFKDFGRNPNNTTDADFDALKTKIKSCAPTVRWFAEAPPAVINQLSYIQQKIRREKEIESKARAARTAGPPNVHGVWLGMSIGKAIQAAAGSLSCEEHRITPLTPRQAYFHYIDCAGQNNESMTIEYSQALPQEAVTSIQYHFTSGEGLATVYELLRTRLQLDQKPDDMDSPALRWTEDPRNQVEITYGGAYSTIWSISVRDKTATDQAEARMNLEVNQAAKAAAGTTPNF